ncbi:hypothetical protein [Dactylosporangium sp. NPDC048998]|uniref:hypothetical protein n=1 Tax=Dactylosporangium sp. NPDC048998 TaxID=3363976 RepID=UPI00371313FD
MSDYRPVFDDHAGAPRPLRWLLAVVLLLGTGAAIDRWLLPHRSSAVDAAATASAEPATTPDGGLGQFPATARGAGDAAAQLEALLTDAADRPAGDARPRIAALLAPDATGLADQLTGAAVAGSPPGSAAAIRQTVIARVWTEHAADPAVLTVGAKVAVQTYGLALLGTGTDGKNTTADAGLTGGWAVHELTVELTDGGWRLAGLQPPVPAPAPDVRGAAPDGSARDPQLLTRVLGPDSWAPGTTA